MQSKEKVSTIVVAIAIPAVGIPLGVSLGLSDGVLLGLLFLAALLAAVVPTMWASWRRKRRRSAV